MSSSTPPPDGCDRPLPRDVRQGLSLFNQRQFFEQHELLEEAWLAESGPVRDLYRGILQIGVGFYHLQRGNFRGARNLLTYGLDRLAPFEPACMSVDVADLRRAASACRAEIERLGRDRIAEFDRRSIPKVRLTDGRIP